jgi:hypothetical protein
MTSVQSGWLWAGETAPACTVMRARESPVPGRALSSASHSMAPQDSHARLAGRIAPPSVVIVVTAAAWSVSVPDRSGE